MIPNKPGHLKDNKKTLMCSLTHSRLYPLTTNFAKHTTKYQQCLTDMQRSKKAVVKNKQESYRAIKRVWFVLNIPITFYTSPIIYRSSITQSLPMLMASSVGRYVRSTVRCQILTNICRFQTNIDEYCQFLTKTRLSEKRHVIQKRKKSLRPPVQP